MSRYAALSAQPRGNTPAKPVATPAKTPTTALPRSSAWGSSKADSDGWRSVTSKPVRNTPAPSSSSSITKPPASGTIKSASGLPRLHKNSTVEDLKAFVVAWSMRNRVRPAEPLNYSVGDHVKAYSEHEMGVDNDGNPTPVKMDQPKDATVVMVDTDAIFVRFRGESDDVAPLEIHASKIRPLIIDYRERARIDSPMTLTQLLMLTFIKRNNNTLLHTVKWDSGKALGFANFKIYLPDSNVSMFATKLRMDERTHFDIIKGWGEHNPDTIPPDANAYIIADMKSVVQPHHTDKSRSTIHYFPGRWAVISYLEYSVLDALANIKPGDNVMDSLKSNLYKNELQMFNRLQELSKMDDVTELFPDQVWWRYQYTPPTAMLQRMQ